MPLIRVTAQGPPSSSAVNFLNRDSTSTLNPTHESSLLQAIRTALRGSDTENGRSIQQSTYFNFKGDMSKEPELAWNAHAAVLSYAGVMVKRWSFNQEGESIQWACIGELEQQVSTSTTATPNDTEQDDRTSRPTFGPFARFQQSPKFDRGPLEPVPAVFVFLRSIGKIYLLNGVEYTFSLPFIVRKAWPLTPHGVMIQRVLERSELVEAEESGDDVLPTIFTVTSAFAEAAAVGLTSGILEEAMGLPPSLKDEDEHSTKPLKSIPPTEMIVWVSRATAFYQGANFVVTVDPDKQLLSIWRYVFIRPKDAPVPSATTKPTALPGAKRQSMSGRRASTLFDGARDRNYPMSPSARSREHALPPETFNLADMPPLSALPGMAPSLSSTTTMASLVSGTGSATQPPSQPQRAGPVRARRNSLSRNDLSNTLDRMALGGRLDPDSVLPPPEHGRMKAAYWMESVFVRQISIEEYVTFSFWPPSLA